MTKNVGNIDRALRALGALASFVCAFMAPIAPLPRAIGFGIVGVYMLFSALSGTCIGYRLMGRSTCPRSVG